MRCCAAVRPFLGMQYLLSAMPYRLWNATMLFQRPLAGWNRIFITFYALCCRLGRMTPSRPGPTPPARVQHPLSRSPQLATNAPLASTIAQPSFQSSSSSSSSSPSYICNRHPGTCARLQFQDTTASTPDRGIRCRLLRRKTCRERSRPNPALPARAAHRAVVAGRLSVPEVVNAGAAHPERAGFLERGHCVGSRQLDEIQVFGQLAAILAASAGGYRS